MMRRKSGTIKFIKAFLSLVVLFTGVSFAQTKPAADVSTDLQRLAKNITEGENSKARGNAIREELESLRIKYSYEPFSAKTRDGRKHLGWNIIAEINSPNATKSLMIGAHYDRVAKGRGAIDNASGSISVLALLKALKKNPLKNYNLKVAFWDLEELGLLGSRHYVKNTLDMPNIYINFDVFGSGDTIWLWAKDSKGKFARILSKTTKESNFLSVVTDTYPPSDHQAFAPKTDSYSFSLGTMSDLRSLTKLLKRQRVKPENFPKVMRIIHTDNDRLDKIDTKAIAKALIVVEKVIRSLDK